MNVHPAGIAICSRCLHFMSCRQSPHKQLCTVKTKPLEVWNFRLQLIQRWHQIKQLGQRYDGDCRILKLVSVQSYSRVRNLLLFDHKENDTALNRAIKLILKAFVPWHLKGSFYNSFYQFSVEQKKQVMFAARHNTQQCWALSKLNTLPRAYPFLLCSVVTLAQWPKSTLEKAIKRNKLSKEINCLRNIYMWRERLNSLLRTNSRQVLATVVLQ